MRFGTLALGWKVFWVRVFSPYTHAYRDLIRRNNNRSSERAIFIAILC
jgi:hypothetical protein